MSVSNTSPAPTSVPTPTSLTRDTSQPLYSQLAKELRSKIESGKWADGTKLPPERSLCSMYDVSRITVRHAIGQLENEGLVTRIQGIGTFVAASKYEQPLAEIHTFESAMKKLGYDASTRIHHAGTVPSDLLLANTLQISTDEPLMTLQLVGFGDNSPIVFYESYFSQEVGASVLSAANELAEVNRPFSTLDLYGREGGPSLKSATQTFEATVADAEIAELLLVPEGAALLKVTSVIRDQSMPVEYRRAFYRGDKYRFVVQRNLDSGFIN